MLLCAGGAATDLRAYQPICFRPFYQLMSRFQRRPEPAPSFRFVLPATILPPATPTCLLLLCRTLLRPHKVCTFDFLT